jgi:hypothetical protein
VSTIIYLTKVKLLARILHMEPISYFFLGLADAEARIACLKSFFMDASNFLVGTAFSIFFLAFSMRGLR